MKFAKLMKRKDKHKSHFLVYIGNLRQQSKYKMLEKADEVGIDIPNILCIVPELTGTKYGLKLSTMF